MAFRKIKFCKRGKYLLHANISQHWISNIIRNTEKYFFREPGLSLQIALHLNCLAGPIRFQEAKMYAFSGKEQCGI